MLLPNGFRPDPRVLYEARSLVNNGFKVKILAWDRNRNLPKREYRQGIIVERIQIGIPFIKVNNPLLLLLLFWLKVLFKVLKFNFSVIHCHDFNTLPIGFTIGKLRRKKIIFDAHESYSEMHKGNLSNFIIKIISLLEKILIRHIDCLITVGEILEAEYKKRGAKRTAVVGNWKSISEFKMSENKVKSHKRDFGIPHKKVVISFYGYLHRDRKVLPLIEAVKRCNYVFLLLAGRGVLEDIIKERVKDLDNVLYIGPYTAERIPTLANISDVIYYGLDDSNPNAKYSAPNKLFEALAAGKGVITGNHGEIAKIVREENCGLVVDDITPSNLIRAFDLIRQNGVLKKYQTNALAAAQKKYNWANAERTLLNIYENLIQ